MIKFKSLKISAAALSTLAVLLAGSPVRAVGLGASIDYSGFSADLGGPEAKGDRIGVGFVLDTNPLGPEVFNYRLDIGYAHTFNSQSLPSSMNGISLNNSFGLGIARNENVRLWVGPAIGLGADFHNGDEGSGVVLSVGGGVQAGLNVAASDSIAIAITAGYQYRYAYNNDGYYYLGDGGANVWLANLSLLFY